jgi:hypothetical protein
MSLIIKDKDVVEFFTAHKIDHEEINRCIVRILKNVIDTEISHNVISSMNEKLSSIQQKMEAIDSSLKINSGEIANTLLIQLSEYRKTYMEDLKLLLSSNNTERITPMLKDITSSLMDKTTILFSEVLPKHQTNISHELSQSLQSFKINLQSEIEKINNSQMDKKTMEENMSNIKKLFYEHENKMSSKLSEIKDTTTLNQQTQGSLNTQVQEILKKFENSSSKGGMSENILFNILLGLFPTSDIEHVGNEQKETGDITFTRTSSTPKILFENKDHTTTNVPKHEITKFIRDCEIQDCCGIMLAQHRSICNKENFEIQINGNNVLLYLNEVKFDKEVIRTAVNVVEQFKMKLDEFGKNIDNNIDQDVLDNINKEFQSFLGRKLAITRLTKEFNEKMISELNSLTLPSLDKYLAPKYASSFTHENACKYCNKQVGKSLAQHYRYCQAKKEIDKKKEDSD